MKRIIALLTMVFMLTACGGEPSPQPTAPPTAEPTPTTSTSPTPKPEKVWLTLDEVNQANIALCFSREGEYPTCRAITMFTSDFSIPDKDYTVSLLAEGLAGVIYNGKYLDKDNPYLTAEDKEEIRWMKQSNLYGQYNLELVEAGKLQYARVPLECVDSVLKEYTGVSYEELTGNKTFDCYNDQPVFYVKQYGNSTGFMCLAGYKQGEKVCLYSTYDILTLEKKDDKYLFVSVQDIESDWDYGKYDVYKENGYLFEDFYYKDRTVYLYNRPQQTAQFNVALSAYNRLLKDIQAGQTKEGGVWRYALYDFTRDGVPELILYKRYQGWIEGYEIYTCKNGKAEFYLEPSWATQHGPLRFMENGMIGISHSGTGITYTFYTFNTDGSYDEIKFYEKRENGVINGKEVSKEEYEKFTKYYLEEFEKKADIDFAPMYDERYY